MNILESNKETIEILQEAVNIAYKYNHSEVLVEHILFVLFDKRYLKGQFFKILDLIFSNTTREIASIRNLIIKEFQNMKMNEINVDFDDVNGKTLDIGDGIFNGDSYKKVLHYADQLRIFLDKDEITPFFLLLGSLAFDNKVNKILLEKGLNQEILIKTYKEIHIEKKNLVGIPLLDDEKTKMNKILELKSYLFSNVFGQQEAIDNIYKYFSRILLGLRTQNNLGSLVFFGENGVGKRTLAKRLNKFFFHTEDSFFYVNGENIGNNKYLLLYDSGLNSFINSNSYGIIYVDNVEFVEKTVISDFFETIIKKNKNNMVYIFGYNIGIEKRIGFGFDDFKDMSVLKNIFDKKYLDEVLHIVNFQNKTESFFEDITKKFLGEVQNIIKIEKSIDFVVDDSLIKTIFKKLYKKGISLSLYKKNIYEYLYDLLGEVIIRKGLDVNFLSANEKIHLIFDDIGKFNYKLLK